MDRASTHRVQSGERPLALPPLAESTQSVESGFNDRLSMAAQLAAGLAYQMNTPLDSISEHAEACLEILTASRTRSLTDHELQGLSSRQIAIMRQATRCSQIVHRLTQFGQDAGPAV